MTEEQNKGPAEELGVVGTYACPHCGRDYPHDSFAHASDYWESRNALAEWINRYGRVTSVPHAQKLIDYVLAWHRGEDMKDVIGAQIPRLRVTPEREPATDAVRDQAVFEKWWAEQEAFTLSFACKGTAWNAWQAALKGKGASQGAEGDQILALNSALEREAVRKLVSEVSRLCQEGWNETYAAAHSNACEEIMARLEILWGERAASTDEQKG